MADATPDEVLLSVQAKLDERRTRAIDLFRKIDKSGDGLISKDEFKTGLSALGWEPPEEDFILLVGLLDKDNSGDINLKEFDRALKAATERARKVGTAQSSPGGVSQPRTPSSPKRRAATANPRQRQQRAPPTPRKQEPLPPMDRMDEVLCKLKGILNRSKTRMIDVFRVIDSSGNGIVSPEELRIGLTRLCFEPSDKDFDVILKGLDKDKTGDVSISEFDKALKLAERKARAEGKALEVDTWDAANLTGKGVVVPTNERYEWAMRSLRTDCGATLQGSPMLLTPWSSGSAWRQASSGPEAKAWSARIGSGSLYDSSVYRQRLLDVAAAPNALAPTLQSPRLPTYRTVHKRPCYANRFGSRPVSVPSEEMHGDIHRSRCSAADKPLASFEFDGGKQQFHNSPTMQSTVDQVVFHRDFDVSGDEKFDESFTKLYEGAFGLPSWYWGK